MESTLLVFLTLSIALNAFLYYSTKNKKPKIDPRTTKISEALKLLDREGQVLIHLEAIHPDDVFLRSRGRA